MFNDFHSEIFSWIRGALFVLFIINISVFFQNKKRLFLNYSLYLFFVFLYFFEPVAPQWLQPLYKVVNYSFLYVSFVFYVEFARILLSTKSKIPKWDRLFVFQKFTLLSFAVLLPVISYSYGVSVAQPIIFLFSALLSLFSFISYYVISRIKGRNVEYFVFGSASFVLLGNISTYYKVAYQGRLDVLSFEPMIFTYVGAIFEALVFTYIMGRIFKQIVENKADLKLQYLLKQKETAELKMTALQSQMNPHFLFNSLNSINNYVLKNDKEQASEYISSFSRLIRTVLKNSECMQISLSEELEVLRMYVKVEQKRIQGGFDFRITVDDALLLRKIEVPPLFLQPYIENSIWHGIARKEGAKHIEVNLKKKNDQVIIAIKDNGIGLHAAKRQNAQMVSKRKSFGASATEKRIFLMYGYNKVSIDLMENPKDSNTGTLVLIKFPLKK